MKTCLYACWKCIVYEFQIRTPQESSTYRHHDVALHEAFPWVLGVVLEALVQEDGPLIACCDNLSGSKSIPGSVLLECATTKGDLINSRLVTPIQLGWAEILPRCDMEKTTIGLDISGQCGGQDRSLRRNYINDCRLQALSVIRPCSGHTFCELDM